ncbi:MAG: hypothetical protein KME11_16700 [Timaviella obliquedivisa GSE-PSE-MK23-08B]|jgi:hypothetical protein|nr:hypothetical protein [Timaviella obliquedivisa GSE-PSE-MK23-08B]
MASTDQVKQYLAFWFQLGKGLIIKNRQDLQLPKPVIQGDRYSSAFEACWQSVMQSHGKNCYLEGTDQTIEQLLSSEWDVAACARCEMPIPILSIGVRSPGCPCEDMPLWPNPELPMPRMPVDSQAQLQKIRDRLAQLNSKDS